MKQWNNGLVNPCQVFKCGLECCWSELIMKHKKDVTDSALIHGKYILVHTLYIGSGKMIYTNCPHFAEAGVRFVRAINTLITPV